MVHEHVRMCVCVCASVSIRKDPQLVYCKNTRMYMCLGEIVYAYVRVCVLILCYESSENGEGGEGERRDR